ncbi:MAG: CDP-alcohol phosphatidyltransferase family protein [Elusimicrobia bacterium]|nr:CDP-alcohol phosphatidyltransferase family protein [Elusimicrobiota bacterium]
MKDRIIKSSRARTWLFPLYLIEPPSMALAVIFYKLRFIHPNLVTVLGFCSYCFSSYSFMIGKYLAGSMCFYIAIILDFTDGKLARMREQPSKLGAKLDHLVNAYGKLLVVLGVFYSFYFIKGHTVLGIMLFAVHYGNHFLIKKILRIKPPSTTDFPAMDELPAEKRPGFFSVKRIMYLFSPYEENFMIFIIGPLIARVTTMILLSSALYLVNSIVLRAKKPEDSLP